MSPFAIAALALTMSADSFAVSVGRGAASGRPRVREALRTGLVFGIVEALTPVIGWLAGMAASHLVEAVDHWIAFALLAGVGLHMLYAALWGADEDDGEAKPRSGSFAVLIATAVGTSLDAMAVGVSLALLQVDIAVIALAIGLSTFVMASGGMLLGCVIGERFGKAAELVAGIALCGLGTAILVEHLSGAQVLAALP